ncbi:hypothetical protein BGZ61DRAFT_88486 [Ilyonectria robusta]|uniref:uncharacterized protein n=1 Tax=Ilyonectria robusta TaxID=1079257 RepID=UPI001E8E0829|nr:uncharacterized protein BGZ61DRAFT_88486 [Ilyonectria robusta]KAH8735932.1 hypothetical protein BGZ61DRAFT_88486 [Ilyonectria robusta]
MPRRLPWKTSTDSKTDRDQPIKSPSPDLPASKSPSVPSAPTSVSRTPFKTAPSRRAVDPEDGVRSPSTSPPPEVPVERFMIPGALHDDRYRMVEDELVNVAHQFTKHLHRAEYNRLKNLAKSQNAATIQEIERPVVGTPTLLTRQRHESARQIAKQQKVLQKGSHSRDMPRVPTGLQGLMESPRKEAKWISTSAAGTATTRAAAGFQSNLSSPPKQRESQQRFSSVKKRRLPRMDDDTTDESDAEPSTPSRSLISKPARLTELSSATSRSTTWPLGTPRAAVAASSSRDSPRPTPSTHRPRVTPVKTGPSRESNDENDDDDDDPFGITKRRIRRQQSKDQFRKPEHKYTLKPKKSSPDNIPSFM